MRMQVRIEGGIAHFPGLARPIILDTDMLPAQDAEEMRRLIAAAHFFALPPATGQPAVHGADARRYTITVDDGPAHSTVQVSDPVTNPHLEALLTFAQKHRSSSM
jgi:hypothetical protein